MKTEPRAQDLAGKQARAPLPACQSLLSMRWSGCKWLVMSLSPGLTLEPA